MLIGSIKGLELNSFNLKEPITALLHTQVSKHTAATCSSVVLYYWMFMQKIIKTCVNVELKLIKVCVVGSRQLEASDQEVPGCFT